MEIGLKRLKLVELKREGRELILNKALSYPFSQKVIEASPLREGVLEPILLKGIVRDLLSFSGIKEKEISLSIPDGFAKISFIDFENLPKKRGDILRFVTWGLKDYLPYPTKEANIDFKVFQNGKEKKGKLMTVLIRQGIIQQYEELFRELGLRPRIINLSSFNVFSLLGSRFLEGERFGLITLFEGFFAIFFYAEGILNFYRSKALSNSSFLEEALSSFIYYRHQNPLHLPEFCYLFTETEIEEGLQNSLSELIHLEIRRVECRDLIKVGREIGERSLNSLAPAIGAAQSLYGYET